MERYFYIIMLAVLMSCIGCRQNWSSSLLLSDDDDSVMVVDRYDRIESRYITTGDFAALQEMSTKYPEETRTLIEDVVRVGRVDDPEINKKFLLYFQDSTLIQIQRDVQEQYASMDDINEELAAACSSLKKMIPTIKMPKVYTQIGSLDQSIIVGNSSIGVCLDKYLGANYPLYAKYYSSQQREQMTRRMIVPDVIAFYLLSLYPMPHLQSDDAQKANDVHMSKIIWIVNKIMKRSVISMHYVEYVDKYMQEHPETSATELLEDVDYKAIVK